MLGNIDHYSRLNATVATMGLIAPDNPADRPLFALADRCFAAAYLRRLGLA